VLIVQEVDDPRGPLTAGDDVGLGAKQPQQAEGGRLLDHVQRITETDRLYKLIFLDNLISYGAENRGSYFGQFKKINYMKKIRIR
jgi:hypothetical protein